MYKGVHKTMEIMADEIKCWQVSTVATFSISEMSFYLEGPVTLKEHITALPKPTGESDIPQRVKPLTDNAVSLCVTFLLVSKQEKIATAGKAMYLSMTGQLCLQNRGYQGLAVSSEHKNVCVCLYMFYVYMFKCTYVQLSTYTQGSYTLTPLKVMVLCCPIIQIIAAMVHFCKKCKCFMLFAYPQTL